MRTITITTYDCASRDALDSDACWREVTVHETYDAALAEARWLYERFGPPGSFRYAVRTHVTTIEEIK